MFSVLWASPSIVVEASTSSTYFSAEIYTEDDHLLQPNGGLSNRLITDFAADVKQGTVGQSYPELSQVVPLEYLETTETNAEFAYNGKEYGFYMAKSGNFFDVLLTDFIYEFDDVNHTNNELRSGSNRFYSSAFIGREQRGTINGKREIILGTICL